MFAELAFHGSSQDVQQLRDAVTVCVDGNNTVDLLVAYRVTGGDTVRVVLLNTTSLLFFNGRQKFCCRLARLSFNHFISHVATTGDVGLRLNSCHYVYCTPRHSAPPAGNSRLWPLLEVTWLFQSLLTDRCAHLVLLTFL